MAIVIDGAYDDFVTNAFQAVYYMDPADRRTDNWDIFGLLPGGAVFRVSVPEKPATFDEDYPNATKVGMMTAT